MYTQCPHCLTLFRITSNQLSSADGTVRCGQCHATFDAQSQLFESLDALKAARLEEFESEEQSFEESVDYASEENPPFSELHTTDEQIETESDIAQLMEQDDGLESEPEYLAEGSESQMSELLDKQSSEIDPGLDNSSLSRQYAAEVEEEDLPIDAKGRPLKVEYKSFQSVAAMRAKNPDAEQPVYPDEELFEKPGLSTATLAWGLGSLLLLVSLTMQMSWFNREQWIKHDLGRKAIELTCLVAGCTPPQLRDLGKLELTQRDLVQHPSLSNTLLLRLVMVNHAGFAQPYPRLRVKLFNNQEKLMAMRIFEPTEYLAEPNSLIPPTTPVEVRMELVDPGKEITGFSFDFL